MILHGMKVVESTLVREVPRLQLRQEFNACSEGVKGEMNRWLRDRFGTYLPVYVVGGDTVLMHPISAAALRARGAK